MKTFTVAIMILILPFISACGGDTCDPTGNWETTATWGAGDCGIVDPAVVIFTVTDGPNGIVLSSDADTSSGRITDDNGECVLSATETTFDVFGDGTTSGTASYNLRSDIDGRITGTGSVTLSGDLNCTQAFSLTGTKR